MRKTIVLSSLLLAFAASSCKKGDDDKTAESKAKPAAPEAKPEAVKTDAHAEEPHVKAKPPIAEAAKAIATIETKSDSKITGTVEFSSSEGKVWVTAKLSGLTPGEHGFHVHEKGDCSSADGKSAGGHFNPTKVDHGDPKGAVHHTGDLGNILANDKGEAELKVELPTSFLSLDPSAVNNIVGKAVVVHGGVDDLKSQPSGAAGPRVGCGVITAE